MSKELTIALVSLIKNHGKVAFEEASDTAITIATAFGLDKQKKAGVRFVRPHRRVTKKKNYAATLAKSSHWTGRIAEFFLNAEKEGKTEIPMREVVDYVVANSDRNSITGSAYNTYITVVNNCGWIRAYKSKNGLKAKTFVKAAR